VVAVSFEEPNIKPSVAAEEAEIEAAEE
jgi:hypothetical protein